MPSLAAISSIEFPDRVTQQAVKSCAQELFSTSFPQIHRMMSAFDNTQIITRNFCQPLSYYAAAHSFGEQNSLYIRIALEYSIKAIEDCLKKANLEKDVITDIIFVSTTGLATPSLDALIINTMRLNAHIRRMPMFGLGCAGGVAGFAKANILAKENPDAVVLFVAAELCSLTFLRNDFSKSNFIGSGLFSDGIAACIITGDNHSNKSGISFSTAQSKLYYDTLDIMGWDFQDDGFKVVFSHDIPTLISKNVRQDVTDFLVQHDLGINDIDNFIFHPGGTKVLAAYESALEIDASVLHHTKAVMSNNGNMSSATVLYVLEQFVSKGYKNGYGLMMAMGPGFSSEMVLLHLNKN